MNKPFWQKRPTYFLIVYFLWSLNSYGQTDLFFSEYVEGDGGCCNKCLEIYNPTASTVDLSNYVIEFYNNGKTTTGNASLVIGDRAAFSTLASFKTVVLCQSKADIALASASDGIFGFGNYNGNDAIVLRKNGVIIDIIGAIGCDPGAAWITGGNSTKDNTLVRKACVEKGNTVGDCGFASLGTEWISLGANNFSNLGSHETGIPSVGISGDNALCERSAITLAATNGFANYAWSNGANTRTTTISTPGTYKVTVTSDKGCTAIATKTVNGESPAIFATISNIKAVSCLPKKDGGFTITPSGGSGGFSYAWETGTSTSRIINGISAGNYEVTITDNNGCSIVKPVEIEGSVTVPLTADISSETCEDRRDGIITLSAVGNGLTYNIDDGVFQENGRFTDLAPGEYLAQVQDNSGCGDQKRVVIAEGSNFDLRNSRVSQAKCQGQGDGSQIILAPQGGEAPYQISFDGGPFTAKKVYSNLEGGTFDIIVRDASGCEKSFQQEISGGSDIKIDYYEITPATCEGVIDGGINIELTGGSDNIGIDILRKSDGFPLVFNPNNPLGGGNHELVIRDFEFDCKIPLSITIPVERTLATEVSIATSCDENKTGSILITPQNGVGPYQYSFGDDAFVVDNLFQDLALQPYVVTTKDNDGCIAIDSVDFEAITDFEIVFAVPRTELCAGNEDGQITIVTNRMEDAVVYSIDGINYKENNVFSGLPAGDYIAYAQLGDCLATKSVTIPAAEAITLEAVLPEIALCEGENDGQLTMMVAGGMAPYSYQLDQDTFQTSSVFSNLLQGRYTLTVRDSNQCEQTFTDIVLPGPVRLDPECTVTQHVSKANGSDGIAKMIIFGGAAPYNVQLVDADFNNIISFDGLVTFDNLPAGDYVVEVIDDNACVSTCSFTIEGPQCDFSISSTHTDATCFDIFDGTISLTIPMDNAPFNIIWSDTTYNGEQNLTNLSSGIYEVTVTDAIGCTDSTMVTIIRPDSIGVIIATANATICAKDSTQLSIIAPDATKYAWSTGDSIETITVDETGSYSVTIEDEMGCSATDEMEITVLKQDTILETRFTCDVANTGIFMLEERNENGCNDIVFRTFELARKDTTFWAERTCDPTEAGMFQTMLVNTFGCDSLIVRTVHLLRLDTTYQTLTSCNSDEVGIVETILMNQFGCDSLLIIETILDKTLPQSFTTNFTCNPIEAGIDTIVLKRSMNCDSLLITETIARTSESTQVTRMTCDTIEAGVDTLLLTNQFLCDSLVIINTQLNPSHVVSFTEESCNPQDTGMTIQVLTNQFGCDSTLTINTILTPMNECQIGFTVLADTICRDEFTGRIQLTINTGTLPFTYYLLDDFYQDTLQNGNILTAETILTDVPVGQYSIILVNERGVQSRERLSIIQLSEINIDAQLSDYNGFAISCIGETDGSIDLGITGGKAPYNYLWEDGTSTKNRQNLAIGNYEVTIVDANNCTNSRIFDLSTNEGLGVDFQTTNSSCAGEDSGQLIIEDLPNANGTTEYSLDGNNFQPIGPLPFTIDNLPTGEYQLFIQDENDCQASRNFTIPIAKEHQLTLGAPQDLSLGDSLILKPTANFDITRFEWTATNPLICTDCSTLGLIPTQDGKYTLTAYDGNGCRISATTNVRIHKESQVFLPNVFSPNGDGLNDRYQIFTGNSVRRINEFQVFDYEGRLMYQANDRQPNDPSIGWDGRFNGRKMLPAVFVVLVDVTLIDGTTKNYRQTMTLIK